MYGKCVRFSRMLADKGYMIITGGGPGIMQAGNRGPAARVPLPSYPPPFRTTAEFVHVPQSAADNL